MVRIHVRQNEQSEDFAGRSVPSHTPAWIRTAERYRASRRGREPRLQEFLARRRKKYPGSESMSGKLLKLYDI